MSDCDRFRNGGGGGVDKRVIVICLSTLTDSEIGRQMSRCVICIQYITNLSKTDPDVWRGQIG
jgi:hypothetical protein